MSTQLVQSNMLPRTQLATLAEALKSVPHTWRSDQLAFFSIPDGDTDLVYEVIFYNTGFNLWEMHFDLLGRTEGDPQTISQPNRAGTGKLTGTGRAFIVFGTVIKVIKDFVATHPKIWGLKVFYSTANDETLQSRKRLYSKLIQQNLGREWVANPPGWQNALNRKTINKAVILVRQKYLENFIKEYDF